MLFVLVIIGLVHFKYVQTEFHKSTKKIANTSNKHTKYITTWLPNGNRGSYINYVITFWGSERKIDFLTYFTCVNKKLDPPSTIT